MELSVTIENNEIYKQKFDGPEHMNAVVGLLMAAPIGGRFNTTVKNNGHDLVFRNSELDIQSLVRVANGIKVVAPRTTKATNGA